MNIGEAFLTNLIFTACSCILPILVGAIYLPIAKKNPKEKRIAPIIALIPESISPYIAVVMMHVMYPLLRRWESYFLDMYSTLSILALSICFILYIPKRQNKNYSVRKDLIINSLGLFSSVFMWSLAVDAFMGEDGLGCMTRRLVSLAILDTDYSMDKIIPSFLAAVISFLFILILNGAKYWVEFHLLRDDAPKVQIKSSNNALSMANKSKAVSALLAFFLGVTGAHRYYLGYKKQGIIQTCGFVSLIIGYTMYLPAVLDDSAGMLLFSALLLLYGAGIAIWVFIDFIRILTGGLMPADGSAYAENHPAQVQVVQAVSSPRDNIDALEKLAKLHEQGILTDDEFQQKKSDLLAKM